MTEKIVGVDQGRPQPADFISLLDQRIRVKIITLLYENVEMSYTELLNALRIDEGLLNFHLRKFKRFLTTTREGTYILSEYGKIAYEVLHSVEQRLQAMDSARSLEIDLRGGLSFDLVGRRVAAFMLDVLLLFVSTGLFLDKNVLQLASELMALRAPSLSLVELSYATISAYSHIFFAAYIMFTVLEAYKGQTLGKFLLGIRVLKEDGGRIGAMDSAVRNLGKAFLLPLDLLIGLLWYRRAGYLRFMDYYTKSVVQRVAAP